MASAVAKKACPARQPPPTYEQKRHRSPGDKARSEEKTMPPAQSRVTLAGSPEADCDLWGSLPFFASAALPAANINEDHHQ